MNNQQSREWVFASNTDPVSKLLGRIKFSPVILFFVLFILNLIINVSLALSFGAWSSTGSRKGLFDDLAGCAIDFLMQPIIITYFVWIQTSGNELINSLFKEGILKPDKQLKKDLDRRKQLIESPAVYYFTATLTIMSSIWFVVTYTNYFGPTASHGWLTASPIITWVRLPIFALAIYSVLLLLYDLAILIIALNKIFQKSKIKLNPLHPDRAGGMGAIGKFFANLGYAIGVIGLTESLVVISEPIRVYTNSTLFFSLLMIILYILFTPIIFFLPLLSSHKAMLQYKDNLLKNLSQEFTSAFEELQECRSKNSRKFESLLRKTRNIREEFSIISELPVWPFNIGNARKYFSLVFSPLLTAIVSFGIDLITKYI